MGIFEITKGKLRRAWERRKAQKLTPEQLEALRSNTVPFRKMEKSLFIALCYTPYKNIIQLSGSTWSSLGCEDGALDKDGIYRIRRCEL